MNCKQITIYTANCRENAANTNYPNECIINSTEELLEATRQDNVCCQFENNRRGTDNFIAADCFSMDIDNTHTDNADYHKTIDDVKKAFPGVAFYYVYSRNHNKVKVKKGIEQAARYKAHVYFPLSHRYEADKRQQLLNTKWAAGCIFPYFDAVAADVAHFYYGIDHPEGQRGEYIPGEICIDQYLVTLAKQQQLTPVITAALTEAQKTAAAILGEQWADSWTDLKTWIDRSTTITGVAPAATDRQYTNTGIAAGDFRGDPSIQQLDKCHYFEAFAQRHNIQYRRQVQGVFVYYFVVCPWEDQHTTEDKNDTGTKITIIPLDDGGAAIRFNCWHSHCYDKKWEDYKAFYEDKAIEQGWQEHKEITTAAGDPGQDQQNIDPLTAFETTIMQDTYKPITTGFSWFDDLLGGGFLRETIAYIMAAPAAGKTTLCQQLGEKIAEQGHRVIYFNFESSRNMMFAKAISAKLASKGIFLTTTDILRGYSWNERQKEAIRAEIEAYRNGTYKNITYCPDKVSANIDTLQKYLTFVGDNAAKAGAEAPVIIIDYIHLLRQEGATDPKEILKKAGGIIREYVKQYHAFAIIISATNRDSNKAGNMSMTSARDSSNIEYDADYAITVNYFDVDAGAVSPTDSEEMAKLTTERLRRLILRTVKNRWGLDGISENVYFNAANNSFYGENDFMPEAIADYAQPFNKLVKQSPEAKKARRVAGVVAGAQMMMLSEENGKAPIDAVVNYFKGERGFSAANIKKWGEGGKYGYLWQAPGLLISTDEEDAANDPQQARQRY